MLWAIVFSGVATFTLQEFAGRLAIATGGDLAAVLRRRYSSGAARFLVLALVAGAVLLGCAAYEAGNILGGVAGAMLAIVLLLGGAADVGFAYPKSSFYTYLLAAGLTIVRCEYLCGFDSSVDRSYVLWGCLAAKAHPIANARMAVS